jgi:hypothetical protein
MLNAIHSCKIHPTAYQCIVADPAKIALLLVEGGLSERDLVVLAVTATHVDTRNCDGTPRISGSYMPRCSICNEIGHFSFDKRHQSTAKDGVR